MNDSDIKALLTRAIQQAIEEVGTINFKKTSFFGSSYQARPCDREAA